MLAQQTMRRLARQASFLSPGIATSASSRPFSTDFVFDEENFRAPELPHGLKVLITHARSIIMHKVVLNQPCDGSVTHSLNCVAD